MRIAPPSLPPHHSGPATRDFQSSISVEALFHKCHLDVRTGPWQRTGVVGEGGLTHPDDTCGRVLQPRWRTGSPWFLDRCDEEAGREEQSSPTFDLQ